MVLYLVIHARVGNVPDVSVFTQLESSGAAGEFAICIANHAGSRLPTING